MKGVSAPRHAGPPPDREEPEHHEQCRCDELQGAVHERQAQPDDQPADVWQDKRGPPRGCAVQLCGPRVWLGVCVALRADDWLTVSPPETDDPVGFHMAIADRD